MSQDAAFFSALRRAVDPVVFAHDCNFHADPWQARFLRSAAPARMLNCSRQVGKSTVVACGSLHRAIYNPGSLVLLLSPAERQSGELMRKVVQFRELAPDVPKVIKDGALEMEFANGSRIIALPGKEATVRGFSAVDILVVDEASRVPDELFMAIQPMLAVSKGQLWTLSSPFGTRGWWYSQYKQIMADMRAGKQPDWEYYEVPATMVPRITAEFLAKERRTLGDWWWQQEYFCIFMDAQKAAFTAADIDGAFAEDVLSWGL